MKPSKFESVGVVCAVGLLSGCNGSDNVPLITQADQQPPWRSSVFRNRMHSRQRRQHWSVRLNPNPFRLHYPTSNPTRR